MIHPSGYALQAVWPQQKGQDGEDQKTRQT